MDPELRKKLYLQKNKTAIITTIVLVILLPVMVIVPQITTQFQQHAAGPADPQITTTAQTSPAAALSPQILNLIIKCFDKPNHSNPCTPAEHTQADLNKDGVIDGADYNLYMRQTSQTK